MFTIGEFSKIRDDSEFPLFLRNRGCDGGGLFDATRHAPAGLRRKSRNVPVVGPWE